MPEGVNIPNEKRWLKSWISHPMFLKKLIANTDIKEEEAKSKIKGFLKNIDNVKVEEIPWSGGSVKGRTIKNTDNDDKKIEFFQNVTRGVPAHEFTHASGLDDLLKYFNNIEYKSNKVSRQNEDAAKKALGKNYEDYELWQGFTTKPFLNRKEKLSDLWNNNKMPRTINVGERNFNPNYDFNDPKFVDYINGTEEVYPRIMNIRFQNNLKPGEIVTPEKMKSIRKTSEADDLFNIYDDEQIMQFLNTLAKKKPTVSDKTLAVLKNKKNGNEEIG
jgi:hypothetical protein